MNNLEKLLEKSKELEKKCKGVKRICYTAYNDLDSDYIGHVLDTVRIKDQIIIEMYLALIDSQEALYDGFLELNLNKSIEVNDEATAHLKKTYDKNRIILEKINELAAERE